MPVVDLLLSGGESNDSFVRNEWHSRQVRESLGEAQRSMCHVKLAMASEWKADGRGVMDCVKIPCNLVSTSVSLAALHLLLVLRQVSPAHGHIGCHSYTAMADDDEIDDEQVSG